MEGSGRFARMRTQTHKLRLPLIGLAVLMLGICFSLLDIYLQQAGANRTASERQLAESTLSNAAALHALLQDKLDLTCTAGAALSAYDDPQSVPGRTTLRAYTTEGGFMTMLVVDRNGLGLDASGNPLDLSKVEAVQKALTGESGYSTAWLDKDASQVLFCACAPVRRSPTSPVAGAVVGVLNTELLSQALALESFSSEGYVCATQPDGLVLYYSPSLGTRLAGARNFWDYPDKESYRAQENLRALFEAGGEGHFYYLSPYRKNVTAYYAPLGFNNWYIFQDLPEAALFSTRLNMVLQILQTVLKVGICFAVLWWCLSRYHRQRETEVERSEASQQLTNQSLEIALTHATIVLFLYDVYSRTLTAHQFTNDQGEALVLQNGPATMVQRGAVAPQHASTFLGLFHQIKSGMATVQADLLLREKDRADYKWHRVVLTTVFDKYRSATHAIVTFEDISDERRREEELALRAHKDPLTGLYNREGLRAQVNRLRCSENRPATGAFLLLDLDHFKTVNDTLGHPTGDLLLKEASRILERLCPPCGACARIGGDEFVLMVPGLDWESAEQLAAQLCAKLPLLTQTLELPVPVGVSVGVHVFDSATAHLDAVYQEADVALYVAKRQRGRWISTRSSDAKVPGD